MVTVERGLDTTPYPARLEDQSLPMYTISAADFKSEGAVDGWVGAPMLPLVTIPGHTTTIAKIYITRATTPSDLVAATSKAVALAQAEAKKLGADAIVFNGSKPTRSNQIVLDYRVPIMKTYNSTTYAEYGHSETLPNGGWGWQIDVIHITCQGWEALDRRCARNSSQPAAKGGLPK